MTQQTAVDYLIEQLTNEGVYIPFGFYEQAKQMEKEQIIQGVLHGIEVLYDCGDEENVNNAEQYYNETYGKE